jgi:plastocyanin
VSDVKAARKPARAPFTNGRFRKEMNMRIRVCIARLAGPLVVAAILLLAGGKNLLVKAQQGTATAPEVKIDNFSFGPATLTVSAGTTVTWTNRDDIPHTVVSDDKVFKSKVLDTEEAFSYTFSKPGTYPYFCSVHPKMTGKVVVQ